MAATTKLFHRRPKTLPITTVHNPTTSLHFFSSFTTPPDFPGDHPSPSPPPESPSPYSSFISGLKASLKQNPQSRTSQSQPPPSPRKPSSSSLPNPPLKSSLEEISKNLQEFRRRSVPPRPPEPWNASPPTSPNSAPPISFQNLYERNLAANNNIAEADGPQSAAEMSFIAIKDSLRNLRSANNEANRSGRSNFQLSRPNLKLGSADSVENLSPVVGGGMGSLPSSLLGSETSREDGDGGDGKMRTDFFRNYTYQELGDKLRLLRPEKKRDGENWFSFEELNERLVKLREMEVRESKSREVGGVSLFELRESFKKMTDQNPKSRINTSKFGVIMHMS